MTDPTIAPIRRTTADGLRVTIEGGLLYLGFHAVHRKPLAPAEVGLLAEVVELCDAAELKAAVRLARKLATPGAILAALEAAKNPPPKPARRPRRGEARTSRYDRRLGLIVVERW
jgi:hypothetical protein